jgi:hypothetical protein
MTACDTFLTDGHRYFRGVVMRNILFAAILILLSSSACIASEKADKCRALANLGRTIMEGRQNGVKMSVFFSNIPDNSAEVFVEKLIIRAYDSPRFDTEEEQREAIDDFENNILFNCIKSF